MAKTQTTERISNSETKRTKLSDAQTRSPRRAHTKGGFAKRTSETMADRREIYTRTNTEMMTANEIEEIEWNELSIGTGAHARTMRKGKTNRRQTSQTKQIKTEPNK